MPILVGTASWTDPTLIACGRFYPKEATSAEARLRFYATQFPLVEVDSSYYGIPSASTAQLWVERTPDSFTMNVKAFRLFTGHQTQLDVLHKDIQQALADGGGVPPGKALYYKKLPVEIVAELWRRYVEALAPLKNAGRLGLVHFQFAPWLLRNREGHDHVQSCIERMAGHTVSVEFRNKTWFQPEHRAGTLRFLQQLGAVHTIVDEPQGFVNSVPAIWETTHPDYALVRLHGRNAATWNVKGATAASDRFNYDYPDAEINALASQVAQLAKSVGRTHVIFNNNMEDQAQRNGRTMMRALALAGEAVSGRSEEGRSNPPSSHRSVTE